MRRHPGGQLGFGNRSVPKFARTAPELWAEQERRREMLAREYVEVTYRRASPLPPTGELRRIVIGEDTLTANEPRELRFIGESMVRNFAPKGARFRPWLRHFGPIVIETMQRSPAWVADVGGGVVLGYVVAEGDVVHDIYVKTDFRGLGIGLGLLRAAGVTLPLVCPMVTLSWKRWTEGHGIPWRLTETKETA